MDGIWSFEFFASPRIIFRAGAMAQIGELTAPLGQRPLLVLGARSPDQRGLAEELRSLLPGAVEARCEGEPTVETIDRVVEVGHDGRCDLVVAVGGGSVLDCGKAAAGMLTNPGSLVDYLEGVGSGRALSAAPLPMIAAPTTAGTGSEVTKNAVISGPGFKKSVRSPALIPTVALVDPALTHGLPPAITASSGMDALTQLVESYLSRGANPLTMALALRGVAAASRNLLRAAEEPDDEAREQMALASLFSGLCLANAGLGAVHGFAAPLGAIGGVAHGLACAALLPQVLRTNLEAARDTEQELPLRQRLADITEAATGQRLTNTDQAVERGLELFEELQRRLEIPRLSALGVTAEQIPAIVAGARGSSMRYNPVELTDEQLEATLRAAW